MRIIEGSTYLDQQVEGRYAQARVLRRERGSRPAGFWRRLLWLLTLAPLWEASHRQARAAALEVDAARYAQGRAGEDLLAEVLARALDDRYILLRNYVPPKAAGGGGDIDGVLVGPPGVIVFEVKTWRGYYHYSGERWLFRPHPRAGWQPTEKNPTLQARNNARRIERTLAAAGLGGVPVRPVIALAGTHAYVEVRAPIAVPLFFVSDRRPDLTWLAKREIADPTAERVLAALARVARPE